MKVTIVPAIGLPIVYLLIVLAVHQSDASISSLHPSIQNADTLRRVEHHDRLKRDANDCNNYCDCEEDCAYEDDDCAKGAKGDAGLPGITGPPGDQGPNGPDGRNGDTGAIGLRGEKGDRGAPGINGSKGNPGSPSLGDKGLPGSPGDQGPRGSIGEPGEPGEQGEDGLSGLPGMKGARGPVGINGPKGEKGNQGSNGPPGKDCITSQGGLKGQPGSAGKPGVNGQNGPGGVEGVAARCPSPENAMARSCIDYAGSEPVRSPNQYEIDPNGGDITDAISVYCKFESDKISTCLSVPKFDIEQSMIQPHFQGHSEFRYSSTRDINEPFAAFRHQFRGLQDRSKGAYQNLTYHCINSTAYQTPTGSYGSSLILIGANGKDIHADPAQRVVYQSPHDGCAHNQDTSDYTDIIYETEHTYRLPIVDVVVRDEHSKSFAIEMVELCFWGVVPKLPSPS